ncbi:fibronectin type III domain-containing protein [Stigmatella sp. ncwal1]|uniref:Fibronectin type III domain-containing protein n=1 Tax=Stigmatella ashevillensis TaxID=2995309 RepID=A0ABT5DK42_9BACT|nr:fibronectin type III domain-containing protein [Stigmatella ashevillena]MDC0713901.1 fibronectin type III domain-containing protein [Stigmatella ashevillena]
MNKSLASTISAVAAAASLCALPLGAAEAATPISQANTTIFGPRVYVFDPTMAAGDINNVANTVFTQMESNQFGPERYALFFKPGSYNVTFNVGFYTHVAGLGQNPDDVNILGGVNVNAKWMPAANSTCNFWRTFENFAVTPSNGITRIAVSQAAPLRRLHVKGELDLFEFDENWNAGWASGGFLADSLVDGAIVPASQQQWFTRNSKMGSWSNAVWNMVFMGSVNTPSGTFPEPPYTVIDRTPIIREKPYLYTSSGQYYVFVPALQTNTQGVSWANGPTPGQSLPISQFYIARPETDTAATLNTALTQGKHLLFTPGIYRLNDTLRVNNANTILLGLGVPSLTPTVGKPVIAVADVPGVKLAGLILEAGPVNSPSILEVGPTGSSADHSANPTFLYDLTVRTGGSWVGRNDVGIKINSNHVVGDQLWLWRADHGEGAAWTTNPTKNGLVVNGRNVTMYGLFNEHHNEYQTLWNGNGGRVYFYQSEIPYDIPNQASWMNGSANGYASYKVANSVTSHEAWGVGVYSYFRDAPVKLENAIEVPNVTGVKIHHMTTIWLNGVAGSEITHVINGTGGRVYGSTPATAMRQTVSEFAGTGVGTPDTQAPTTPANLLATATSSSQINLSWSASSDNVGVSGYDVYRNGSAVGSSGTNSYSDTGLAASTAYSYTVKARDAAGNASAASNTATATTQAGGGSGTEFTYGAANVNSTQALLWFKPTGFTASYVIVHYSYSGIGQQNVTMTYNSSSARFETNVTGLSAGKVVTYSFTYNKNGAQYDSGTYTWTKP